jgi:hypothetical protein
MKYILIRDDDVNFFTSPDVLKEVYGFIFENDIPINFSVIPAVNTAAKTESCHFGAGNPEPFLPEDIAGEDKQFPITGNPDLLRFLNAVNKKEFLLHGFEHSGKSGKYEFESEDKDVIEDKLIKGIAIFEKAFGVIPETFVAPQDKYSKTAFFGIKSRFKTLSLGWVDSSRIPFSLYCRYVQMKLMHRNYICDGKFLISEHPGCMFSKFTDIHKMSEHLDKYIINHQITVIVTHHWEFFDNGILNRDLLAAFRRRITGLMGKCEFLTFSKLRGKFFN